MGRVFKAKDLRLNRLVALKLIHGNDPELHRRLLREAQAQARIEHDNVCKVYEVGDVKGFPYIAMQFIPGDSLKEAKGRITIEQKVEVIRKVACGLDAAHRIGIVHRDIKPANIMLECTEDGDLHPYLTDFGLARELAAAKPSMRGMIEGTPAYMAPEHLLGDPNHLDRRTDIYSLGATLYDLLSGRPPFLGTNNVEIMLAAISQKPAPLNESNRAIPLDLDAIVLKCLEKDAARRYDSAKALADDLQRYVDGDPVLARQTGLLYRLAKRARKQKALMALASAALVCIALLGGAWIRARLSAAEQARLSQELGHNITDMETSMRLAYSLPLHDTRRDEAVIRAKMADIERQMVKLTALGEGPGRYALGRGHLALHDFEGAAAHLSAAYDAGYAGPEVVLTLGQALAGLYRNALDEAQRIEDKRLREQRLKRVEGKYLEPALRYLKESESARADSRAYVEGLIALYEKRYDEARTKAKEAFDACPWLYEAKKIEGDSYVAEGREAHEKGDYRGAKDRYRLATDALRVASEIASSDADILSAEAEVWIEIMDVDKGLGTSPRQALENAIATLDRSLIATPERSGPSSKKALAFFRMGHYQTLINENPTAYLDKGLDAAREAIRRDPSDALAWNAIGFLHITRANYLLSIGQDPRPWLDQATEGLTRSISVNPNSEWAWNDLQLVATTSAEYELTRGLDPRRSVQRAIEMYDHAIASEAQYAIPHSNIAYAFALSARYETEHGMDPRASVRQAVEKGEEAAKISPGFYATYTNISLAYTILSQHELDIGLDPTSSADRAIESATTATKLNPKCIEAERYAAAAHCIKAIYAASAGDDPTEELRRARRHLDASAAVSLTEPLAARLRAVAAIVAARWEIREGRDAGKVLGEAQAALDLALKGNPNDANNLQTSADLSLTRSDRPNQGRADVAREAAVGFAALEKALAVNPRMARAMATRGALYLAMARLVGSAETRPHEISKARSSLDEALRENSNLERVLQPLVAEAKQLSTDTPIPPAVLSRAAFGASTAP